MTESIIICFGDALIDMLQNPGDADPPQFTQYPGGAPANVAAAVARLGGQSHFAGAVGADAFGRYLQQTLQGLGVGIAMMPTTDKGLTPLAIVNLKADGERSFSFYHLKTAPQFFTKANFKAELFQPTPLFHFVSNILTTPGLLATTQAGVELARAQDGLSSFDVNLRPGFWPEPKLMRPHIEIMLGQADILKVSEEELAYLAENRNPLTCIESWLAAGTGLICVTRGEAGLDYYTPALRGSLPAFPVQALDTTAAGDAFIGGVLYGLSQQVQGRAAFRAWQQDAEQVRTVLRLGAACGAIAVSRFGAIPSLPTQADIAPFLLTGDSEPG
ncbi:MAG: carbohydrate kinase [Candidatus Competibacteraceae bacterium]|nr:carbohydrate kinase [Candidatus Competibacteraceae bacterium]MCB1804762.1 carbohydrate kinase [Candidatus Competibacteraceae bacterium]MCB1810578.1 carbohydrate kinase [Candidatus Competibacteraceae bacterium]